MAKTETTESIREINEMPVVDTGKTKNKPFFSVCIPTYNRATLLPQAIESILLQDFTDFELIICDNASSDNTEEVVRKYQDNRVRYVRYDTLVNMYANHNRCINLVQAEWLVFLHSDDCFINNQVINNIYQVLPDLTEDCNVITGKNHILQSWRRDYPKSLSHLSILSKNTSLIDILISNMGISPSGSFYKRDFLSNNQFDEWGTNSEVFTADRTMAIVTLMRNKKICVLDQVFIKRDYSASASYQANFNCNWHIGLSRTMKNIVNDPEWQKIEPLLINNLGLYGKHSLDILIRLSFSKEWKCFWRLIIKIPKYHLMNWRVMHIFVIMLFGHRFYITILTIYRQNFLGRKKPNNILNFTSQRRTKGTES